MEKSIVLRMIASIPIVGTALALWIEHTQLGVAEHGKFVGLLRGLIVGLVIAVTLIVASEAAIAAFDVGREWVSVNYTAGWKAQVRTRVADEQDARDMEAYKKAHPDEYPESKPVASKPCGDEVLIAGCFWAKLPYFEKASFVVGVHDAIHKNYDGRELFPLGSYADIVKRLDAFYQEPTNKTTPVIDALEGIQ